MNDYSNRKNQPFNRWIDKWMRWYQCKKKFNEPNKNMKKKFQQKSKRPKRINFVIFKSHWSIALLLWDFFFFFLLDYQTSFVSLSGFSICFYNCCCCCCWCFAIFFLFCFCFLSTFEPLLLSIVTRNGWEWKKNQMKQCIYVSDDKEMMLLKKRQLFEHSFFSFPLATMQSS